MAKAIADAVANAMLDAIASLATHLSLHTAYPGTGGSSEVTGGSPAYARKAEAWASAASRSKTVASAKTFDVPAATEVQFVGMWSALTVGTFRGFLIPGSTGLLPFAVDESTDFINCDNHGFANADKIVFVNDTAPTGLTEGTIYYVVSSAADQFKVSATSGGSAIDLTNDAGVNCRVSKIVTEVFAAQGTYQVAATTAVSLP